MSIQVVWNAWLATVGHSAVHSLGASSLVEEAADSLDLSSGGHVAVLAHAVGLSTLSQASPFLARAAEVVQVIPLCLWVVIHCVCCVLPVWATLAWLWSCDCHIVQRTP